MQIKLSKLTRKERGQALVIVLCLLALGGLVIIPLLNYAYTGLSTSQIYWERVPLSYAADAGLEDGIWKADNDEIALDLYDYVNEYTYFLPESINGKTVEVSARQVWPLAGLESDENGTDPATGLRITGGIVNAEGRFEARISYATPEVNLLIDRVGVWLPPDFEYVNNSTTIMTTENPIEETDWNGGKALIWDFEPAVNFLDLPDLESEEPIEGGFQPAVQHPTVKTLRFNVTPEGEVTNGSFPWVRTTNPEAYLSWESGLTIYEINSTATDNATGKSINVDGYTYTSEGVDTGWLDTGGSLMSGDYRAFGNTLMQDLNLDRSRETLLDESSATVDDIPPDSEVAFAYLYWSGWRDYSGSMQADKTCTFRILPETQSMRPNASGNYTECSPHGAAINYQCVDEAVADSDSTYVQTGMESETLRPNASGSHTECAPVGDSPNYRCVDEATADGDSTYVQTGYAPEVLRPNAAGTYTQCDPVGDSYNYRCVDEATADDDSTYVRTWYGGTNIDTYNIANHSVGTGIINSVTIYTRTGATSTGHTAQTVIRTHSTNYYGTNTSIPTSYTQLSTIYTTNPYTGSAWTWSEIDALEIGVRHRDLNGGYPKTTQVFAEVSYGAVEEQTTTLRPDAAGDETNITYQAPSSGAHWDKVDDVTSDNFSTYVYTNVRSEGIAYKASTEGYSGTGQSSLAFNHNLQNPSGKNRLLVVGVCWEDAEATATVSSITFSGRAMTKVTDVVVGTGYSNYIGLWYLLDSGLPATTGYKQLSITVSQTITRQIYAVVMEYSGVKQAAPDDYDTHANTSAGSTSITITSAADGSVAVACVGAGGTTDPAGNENNVTTRQSQVLDSSAGGGGGHLDVAAGNITFGWNNLSTREGMVGAIWQPAITLYERDLYNVSDYSGEVAISGVTVYFRFSGDQVGVVDYTGYARAAIKTNGTVYLGSAESQTGKTFVTKSYTWTANPSTGSPWTWDDIAALQVGVELAGTSTTQAYCTQVYAEVSYTPSETDIDTYNIANHSAGSGVINSVTVYIRSRATSSADPHAAQTVLRTNNTDYFGTYTLLTASYAELSTTYTTNPNTGSAWTWGEIDALEAGVKHYDNGDGSVRTTQVYVSVDYGPTEGMDTYNIEDNTVGSGVINSVTVHARCKGTVSADTHAAETVIRTHDTNYFGTNTLLPTAYTDLSTTYTTNPYTGSAWTWSEINALQAGIKQYDQGNGSVRCTQVYVSLEYGPFYEEELTADTWWLVENSAPDYSYSCFKDLSDILISVVPGGNATYTVGDVDGDTGTEWSYAGWSMIIIYSCPYEQGQQFFLWDQMMFAGTNAQGSFTIEGFVAPVDAQATLTCFVCEGDDWYDNDFLQFNGYYMSDAINPQNDVWNGKSSGLGGEIIDGVDIDTFDVSSPIINQGDTSAVVVFSTAQDNWNLIYLVLAFRSELAVLTPSSTGIFSYGLGGG